MKQQVAICAGLLMLGMGAASPAAAQAFYPAPRLYPGPGIPDAGLSPFEITRILRASGFTPVSRPVRRGPYYVLLAVDRAGRDMRIMVDARQGDIVNVRPSAAGAPYGPEIAPAPPGAAAPDLLAAPPRVPLPTGEEPPVPPRAVPNPRTATPPAPAPSSPSGSPSPAPAPTRSVAAAPAPAPAPTHSAVADPPELPSPPPLPRPRPQLTAVDEPAETPAPAPPVPAPAVPAAHKPLFFGGASAAKRDNNESAPIE